MLTVVMLSSVCGYAYEPLVREGQTWNHSVEVHAQAFMDVIQYQFHLGASVELNGKTYNPVMNGETVCGYVRQEGNKVFLLVDEEHISPIPSEYGGILPIGDDVLLYDFDAKPGDKYMTVSVEPFSTRLGDIFAYYKLLEIVVREVDTVVVNGRKRTRQRATADGWYKCTFVEGIGINTGFFYLPQYVFEEGSYSKTLFDNMSDAEGNIIFTAADFDAPAYDAGVPEVGFDTGMTPAKDNKMYDLNGREIHNPLPGTVYIQNGEKHVAK